MAKVAFQAPGYTIAEIETLVANATSLSTSVATELTKIDEAITEAGQTACTWDGIDWWFLWGSNTFPTVASTAAYNLRTVNTNAMVDMLAPRRLWRSNMLMRQMPYHEYLNLYRTESSGTEGTPDSYAVDGDLTAYLYRTPSGVETITVDYIKRHSKITGAGSLDTALIIPAEFQGGIYVQGAIWLLRNEKTDSRSLRNCTAFTETIMQMNAAGADKYDESLMGGVMYPGGKSVVVFEDL